MNQQQHHTNSLCVAEILWNLSAAAGRTSRRGATPFSVVRRVFPSLAFSASVNAAHVHAAGMQEQSRYCTGAAQTAVFPEFSNDVEKSHA